MRPFALTAAALLLAALPIAPGFATAQTPAPNAPSTYKDTSMLRAPGTSTVAIFAFEDLECPACARAFPLVHQASEHYKIPLVRHDFPLQMHVWSRDGAIIARYIQDKISPQAAEEYRGAVFSNQTSISSKEDLQSFTQRYFQQHGRAMPFVVDPTSQFSKEVQADYDLGARIGLNHTPSIFIVTKKNFTEVTDINQLYQTIDTVSATANPPTGGKTTNSKLHRSPAGQR